MSAVVIRQLYDQVEAYRKLAKHHEDQYEILLRAAKDATLYREGTDKSNAAHAVINEAWVLNNMSERTKSNGKEEINN